tara:strand:- start:92 stop:520 length:429 start_codon:yes stop_codon:yes gene_type:complete
MKVTVNEGQRFPQEEVLAMCEAINTTGLTTLKGGELHHTQRELNYEPERDWVWVNTNLSRDDEARACLKAIGFRFSSSKAHPSQWGNACLKPKRFGGNATKAKAGVWVGETRDEAKSTRGSLTQQKPKPDAGILNMLDQLNQ